jgi:hypothetical protein
MTPQFWHAVVKRLMPLKRRLVFGWAAGLIAAAAALSMSALLQAGEKWQFLSILFPVILLFWCVGLLIVVSLYGELPVKPTGAIGGLFYYWHLSVGWFGAVFLSVWFVGLSFFTFVVPVLILFSDGR